MNDNFGFVEDENTQQNKKVLYPFGFVPDNTEPKASSVIQGFGQSALMGYLPEAQAVAGKITNALPNPSDTATQELEQRGFGVTPLENQNAGVSLEEARKRNNTLKNDNPWSYGLGEVGGALATAPIVGGLLGKAGFVSEPVGIISGAKEGAKAGAVIGAAYNPNQNPDEEGLGLIPRAMSAVTGGITGGALGAVGGLITSPKAAQNTAQEAAIRAFKPKASEADRMGVDKLKQLGQTALDEGIISKNPRSYEDLANETSIALDSKGKELDQWINRISDAAEQKSRSLGIPANQEQGLISSGQPARVGINKNAVIDSINEELSHLSSVPGKQSQTAKIESILQDFDRSNPDILPLKQANDLKIALGKNINWYRNTSISDVPDNELVYRSLYNKLKTGIENASESLADQLGPNAKNDYIKTKNAYGNLSSLEEMANRAAGRNIVNRRFSLTDYISGGSLGGILMSGAHGNPAGMLKGAAGMAGGMVMNKIARQSADQALAYRLNGLSNVMKQYPKTMGQIGNYAAAKGVPAAAGLLGGNSDLKDQAKQGAIEGIKSGLDSLSSPSSPKEKKKAPKKQGTLVNEMSNQARL